MCSHATVTDSDLLSLIGTYDWDLYFYLLGCSTHQNLMSCSRILNSIKGFKLNQLQWSNITPQPLPLSPTAAGKLWPFILSALMVIFFLFCFFLLFFFFLFQKSLVCCTLPSASSSFHQAVLSAAWIIFWFSRLLSRCNSNTFFSVWLDAPCVGEV